MLGLLCYIVVAAVFSTTMVRRNRTPSIAAAPVAALRTKTGTREQAVRLRVRYEVAKQRTAALGLIIT